MDEKQKEYILKTFRRVYFNGKYETEEGEKLLKRKQDFLNLSDQEVDKVINDRIEKYDQILNLMKEFYSDSSKLEDYEKEEIEDYRSLLNLKKEEINKLKKKITTKSNNKNKTKENTKKDEEDILVKKFELENNEYEIEIVLDSKKIEFFQLFNLAYKEAGFQKLYNKLDKPKYFANYTFEKYKNDIIKTFDYLDDYLKNYINNNDSEYLKYYDIKNDINFNKFDKVLLEIEEIIEKYSLKVEKRAALLNSGSSNNNYVMGNSGVAKGFLIGSAIGNMIKSSNKKKKLRNYQKKLQKRMLREVKPLRDQIVSEISNFLETGENIEFDEGESVEAVEESNVGTVVIKKVSCSKDGCNIGL